MSPRVKNIFDNSDTGIILWGVKRIAFALFFVFCLFSMLGCQTSKKSESLQAQSLQIGAKNFSLENIKNSLSAISLSFEDPFGSGKESVVGVELTSLLKTLVSEDWDKMDGIVFTAHDGYKVEIPVTKILRYNPILAYQYSDKSRAFVVNKNIKVFGNRDLGPFYLVWDNIKYPELYKKANKDWPFQIIRLDLIRYASQNVNSVPILTNLACKTEEK